MKRRALNANCALLAAILIVGCSGVEDEELRQWMVSETKDMRGRVPPLPQVKPYEPVPYDAATLIDPFNPAKAQIGQKQVNSGGGPDLNRPKEPLESFSLESIKYVGLLSKNRQSVAIVLADSALYQVRVGGYMGQNFGVVTKITEADISLREMIQDPAGEWAERVSTLQLQAKEGRK